MTLDSNAYVSRLLRFRLKFFIKRRLSRLTTIGGAALAGLIVEFVEKGGKDEETIRIDSDVGFIWVGWFVAASKRQ
jgi:hypothetical protein